MPLQAPTPGALPAAPATARADPTPTTPPADGVVLLESMGSTRVQAAAALAATGNDVARATDWILCRAGELGTADAETGGGGGKAQTAHAASDPQPPPARLGQAFAYAQLAAATDAFDAAHGIGEGSFGAVFRCTLPGLGLDCAVKVFKDDGAAAAGASDGAAREMFEKEARTLAAHPHPNFVQLLGTSVDGPRLCLVTAFMAGGCVRSRLTSGPLLTWRQRLTAAADACRGLAYLHGPQLGKVHRDVKPANILLDSAQVRILPHVLMGIGCVNNDCFCTLWHARPTRMRVAKHPIFQEIKVTKRTMLWLTRFHAIQVLRAVLGDFGLVRDGQTSLGKTDKTSKPLGTAAFMSHEAVQGKITPAMDVYAMGVTLLELVAGRPAEGAGDGDALAIAMEEALEALEDNGDATEALAFVDGRLAPVPPDHDVAAVLAHLPKVRTHPGSW